MSMPSEQSRAQDQPSKRDHRRRHGSRRGILINGNKGREAVKDTAKERQNSTLRSYGGKEETKQPWTGRADPSQLARQNRWFSRRIVA